MIQDLTTETNSSHSSNPLWNHFHDNTPLLFSFILFSAYAIIFLIGLITNILVIVVIIKCRRMRTLTNRFLLNLAISDLLATLICLPPTAYHHYDKRWIFGEFLCRFVPFIQGTSVAVSIFTLMTVSIDRFIAIHKPIHTKILCTPSRTIVIIGLIWISAFLLMIPLILHHRIIDPIDIKLTACAEEWQQNMNARLAYDFILLFVLFILPLTLMTYCYVRISFSLWFIDSNGRRSLTSLSSTTNVARFSSNSEEIPPIDTDDVRRQASQKHRPYYIHYHKKYENDFQRKQPYQMKQEEYRSLINSTGRKLPLHRPRRSTTMTDMKPKSLSSATITTTSHALCHRSSSLIGRRFGENGYIYNHSTDIQQGRQIPFRQRQSTSPYPSGILRTSLTSLQSQNRILNTTNRTSNNQLHHHRSFADVEHASRFLQSRRRVVKLLITLGKKYRFVFLNKTQQLILFPFYLLVVVFFLTRLPYNIVSIYIDITSNTYIPENTFSNRTKSETIDDVTVDYSSQETHADKKMTLVLYVSPILQLFSLSNSAINPLCYCFMSHTVKHIITLIRQKLRRRGQNKAPSIPLTQRPVVPNQPNKMMVQHRNSHEING